MEWFDQEDSESIPVREIKFPDASNGDLKGHFCFYITARIVSFPHQTENRAFQK